MADTTPIATPSNGNESCSFQRTISLYDWWLVKAKNDFQGKRLAVAGISSRKNEAVRVFVSAAVIKRYDMFSLETADGKYIIIRGFINEQRTLENGFTSEVFNHFLFGFPPNWENYSLDCFREESNILNDSCAEILSNGVENLICTSLVSPADAPGDHEKPFPENDCNVSKEVGEVNVACSTGSNKHNARLHDIQVYQNKKPASGDLPNHPDNEENSTSVTLEGRKSMAAPTIQSQSWSKCTIDPCGEKTIPTSVSAEEAPGHHKLPFPENECNESKEIGRVNVAFSNGGKRRSARLHNIKVCQQKKQNASGGLPSHPADEENSTSVTLEGLKRTATPIQSQSRSEYSIEPCVENTIPTFLVNAEEAPGHCKKQFPENECNVSKEIGGANVACSSGGKRRSAMSHNIKVYQQKKQPASGVPPKHPDNEKSTPVALENCSVVGPSPATPIQSQSRRQLSTSSEQRVRKSASRISKSLFPTSKNFYKKKRAMEKSKLVSPMRKQTKSASAVKNPREKDLSHLIRGSQQKISRVSSESFSFSKSRSGRLLLPPLEFWRNQIPIYNAAHELTEIQDGASMISPCRGSSPSLSRFNNQKRAAGCGKWS